MIEHAVSPETNRIIVIGAGIAGLTTAMHLQRAGFAVAIFEASDGVGGRVRSDRHPEGFILDRGFQVVLEAYPALRRAVDIDAALKPSRFGNGAMIWDGKSRQLLASPLATPYALPRALMTSSLKHKDKLLLVRLAARARMSSWQSVTEATVARHAAGSGIDLLRANGFSDTFVESFARPFWGGITLDRSLGSTAGSLLFTTKMFLEGSALLPESGMQGLPDALASRLDENTIHLNARIDAIEITDRNVVGMWSGGSLIEGRAVVLATDAHSAKQLCPSIEFPQDPRGCITVYLAGTREPGIGKYLLLNAEEQSGVNHLAPLSAVAPSYAPVGQHLVAAVFLDHPRHDDLSDDGIAQLARVDTARMLGHRFEDWRALSVVRVPFSQFHQPPGFASKLPLNRTATTGLYLAGEFTHDSSVNGAMLSGETAAQAIIHDLRSNGR
ncbi:NAD(P)/FAD-dependent oxidoreductase [soil metagenome]